MSLPAAGAPDPTGRPARQPIAGGPALAPDRQSVGALVSEAWASRELLGLFGSRVVRKTYAKTKLGAWWLFVRPVVDTGGKLLLFGSVLNVAGPPGGAPYLLVLLIGMQAWRLFDQTLLWTTRSFDRFAKLTRTFAFPLLIVPIAGSAFGWVEFVIYSGLVVIAFLAFLAVDGHLYLAVGPDLLLGAFALALALGLALGVGLWLSVLNARWRDVRLSVRYVLEVWFYATPVVYPLSQLPHGVQTFAQVNPLTPVLEMAKQGFLGAGDVTWLGVAWAVVSTALAISSGLWFFGRNASHFNTPSPSDGEDGDDDDE